MMQITWNVPGILQDDVEDYKPRIPQTNVTEADYNVEVRGVATDCFQDKYKVQGL
jgi:hypothetical protein